MDIKVIRTNFNEEATIGEMYVNGIFQCYTLEDVVRPAGAPKVYGKTAIPEGTYKVKLTMSQRFKYVLPLLVDVPGFEGIRIHPGNTAADTEGCILVGQSKKEPNFVGQSRLAFANLFQKLSAYQGDITITIQAKR